MLQGKETALRCFLWVGKVQACVFQDSQEAVIVLESVKIKF